MQKFSGVAQDLSGNVISTVSVTVYLVGTAVLATLYSDSSFTSKTNPFQSNTDGTFQFYAADGRYDVVFAKSGYSFPAAASSDLLLDNLASVLSPASLSGNQNNYNPTNGLAASIWRLTSSTSVTITGIIAGTNGQHLVLINVGTNLITVSHESGSSDAASRIVVGTGADAVLVGGGSLSLIYDTTTARWRDVKTSSAGVPLTQTFRGLHLQTHPDSDISVKAVALVHADEIIMHDGARVTDWNNLAADITVVGAGGRDTGSELASTWYEIYAIRKSSDGTKNLLLHQAKDYFEDETFVTTDTQRALRVLTGTPTDKIAQGFKVDTTGLCPFVNVVIVRNNSPTGNVWFTIETDSAGDPSGTVLATSDKMSVVGVSTSNQMIRFLFRSPATLTAATQYHLVFQGDYARSDTVHILWRGLIAGGYSNGASREYNGTTWSATAGGSGLDRAFIVYITRNDTAVTMPSGYDQRCLVGYVRNDGSSNFVSFVGKDREYYTSPLSVFTTMASTIPSLHNMSEWLPPVPVSGIGFTVKNSTIAHNYVGGVPEGYGAPLISTTTWVANSGFSFLGPTRTEAQAVYFVVSGGDMNSCYIHVFEW